MPIVCFGINHHTAPLTLRERLAFTEADQREALSSRWLRDLGPRVGIAEFALLSTCNRVELYAATDDVTRRFHQVPDELGLALARLRGLDPAAINGWAYRHSGTGAVRHLCRVAAGLDSMVLGESEVLGQVAAARDVAAEEGAAGPVLHAAFHTAVRAGRRARAETGICRAPASVSSEAARAVREWVPALATASVLVIGTGRMGRLAGEALRAQGVRDLQVVSRTAAHADRVAAALGARPLAWHRLEAAIRDADVILSTTGAPHAVLTVELVGSARRGGEARPLVLVDLAVPRDVEPAVRDLPGVRLLDLDDLHARLKGHRSERHGEIPRVEAIVEQEVARFEEWRHGVRLRPLIAELRTRADQLRAREVERALRRMGGVPDVVREQLDAFSRSLVSKLLHQPTRRLRQETDPERSQTYEGVTRDLFGLTADDGGPGPGGSP